MPDPASDSVAAHVQANPTLQPDNTTVSFAQAATIIGLLQQIRDNQAELLRIQENSQDA